MAQIVLLLFTPVILFSQNGNEQFKWWNNKHNWDGVTPWHQYIGLSTAYMGPNALPVPEVKDASLSKYPELDYSSNYYFQKGDHTADANIKFTYPFDRVQVSAWIVPLEYFHITDTLIRDKRAIRYENPEGTASGDLYMGTHVKIIDNPQWPDVVLGFVFRTASGSKLSMARFTDMPGYYFDLSVGHTFRPDHEKLKKIRLYGMAGFYVYQTYDLLHNQNDALLYGLGANMDFENISITNQLGGYYGYLDIGDRPLVYRFKFKFKQQHFDWFLRYQYGINDFPYQSTGIGFTWKIPDIKAEK